MGSSGASSGARPVWKNPAPRLRPHVLRPTQGLIDLHLAQQLVPTVKRFAPGASPHILLLHGLRRHLPCNKFGCLLVDHFSISPDAGYARCNLVCTALFFNSAGHIQANTLPRHRVTQFTRPRKQARSGRCNCCTLGSTRWTDACTGCCFSFISFPSSFCRCWTLASGC